MFKLFRAVLEASPNTAQLWFSYIDALTKLGKLSEAKAVLDKAREKGAKGEGFDNFGRSGEGITASAELKTQNNEPTQDRLRPVMELHRQGDLQKVLETASDLLKTFPNSVVLHNFRGDS